MKKLLLFLFIVGSLSAQTTVKTESGELNGAAFKIFVPEDWDGKLLMYAHGYEFMGSPRQSENPQFEMRMKVFLDKGFAVAASDYAYQGFALAQGVDDTEALRKYFIEKYGAPTQTIMAGHSMGGGVTLAMLENFGQFYDGGLALCPLSSRPYLQCRKEFDIYATFNGLFPGVVTNLSDIFDLEKPYLAQDSRKMVAKAQEIKKAILAKDSILGKAFASRFDLKFDDLPFSLFFNENVLRDLAQKAGGNPFDNTNTVYSGFPDNWEVNQKAERLGATVDPNVIFSKYDRTGNIDKPAVILHTIYDQLIPPTFGVTNYENMVIEQGNTNFLTVKYTKGQGHCQFSDEETEAAFESLLNWLETGQKALAGPIE
ncbi:alpha/beta hydrolase family protein [Maribacter sp. CXY002]|uniref:alpha/beta hydrolase family protein n=1 Tax=Maribacter luteocoastalis TaxID=3407671 RepID=UPI003B685EC7